MEAFGFPEISPQLRSTGYGRPTPFLDRGAFVESQAELLPQMKAQEAQQKAFDERLSMERQSRADARRDANISLGIKGAELGYNIGMNPTVQRYGRRVIDALRPKPVPVRGDIGPLPGTSEPTRLASAGGVSDAGGNWFDSIGQPTTPDAPSMTDNLLSGRGVLPKLSGDGFGTTAGNLAIGAGAGMLANAAIEGSNLGESLSKRVGGGEKEWDLAATSLASFALGGVPGLVGNLAVSGIKEFGKKNCIIVTACHGADSEEVAISREYRDRYMNKQQLRAYYAMSEKLVPLLEQNDDMREYVKETLVAPLIKFGAWRLGRTREHPTPQEIAVAKNFLVYLADVGSTMHEPFVRANGEVI